METPFSLQFLQVPNVLDSSLFYLFIYLFLAFWLSSVVIINNIFVCLFHTSVVNIFE